MSLRWHSSFLGDEILSGDREVLTVVNRGSANCALRLDMPITDALSELNCLRNAQARFCFSRTAHAICRVAKIRALVGQLWIYPHCPRGSVCID
jgi:hypothetical protein